jgi:hypothetical protein
MRSTSVISLALLLLAGCATKETTYWQKDKKHHTIVVHHVRKSFGCVHDQTEELSTKVMMPAEVAVYDIGRLPDGHGGMSEAHRYYRVVQSEHFDLRLPETGKGWKYVGSKKPIGPKKLFYNPTYTPPPQSERITDALNRAREGERQAEEAKKQLQDATQKVTDRIAEDNVLREELQNQVEANEELKRQIDKGVDGSFSTHHAAPAATPQSGGDALANWGTSINQP